MNKDACQHWDCCSKCLARDCKEEEEEEPKLRRNRTQGEFDDWPSNAQMEYFKRGGR